LVDRAADLGCSTLALLDRDGVYGAPRFHKAALAAGITPIIGAELTLNPAGEAGQAGRAGRGGHRGSARSTVLPLPPVQPIQPILLPVLCESADGYRNLCRLITRMKMQAPKGEGAVTLDDLDGRVGGL